jgi:two-component system response regulator HydG
VARFSLPPLRERREDVPLLVQYFLDKFNRKLGFHPGARLAEDVMSAVVQYTFPGNIRELENMVEQAVAFSGGGLIGIDDIVPQVPRKKSSAGRTLADIVDDAEREAIEAALAAHDRNRERAAETLGISPTTLWRKMTRLNVNFGA